MSKDDEIVPIGYDIEIGKDGTVTFLKGIFDPTETKHESVRKLANSLAAHCDERTADLKAQIAALDDWLDANPEHLVGDLWEGEHDPGVEWKVVAVNNSFVVLMPPDLNAEPEVIHKASLVAKWGWRKL